MARRKRAGGRPARKEPPSIRASVSLRPETYRTLEALARQKKVSTAWILRDAAEKYVAEQWPLLAPAERSGRGKRGKPMNGWERIGHASGRIERGESGQCAAHREPYTQRDRTGQKELCLERAAGNHYHTGKPVTLFHAEVAFGPLTAHHFRATDRVASATRLTSVAFLCGPENSGPFSFLPVA